MLTPMRAPPGFKVFTPQAHDALRDDARLPRPRACHWSVITVTRGAARPGRRGAPGPTTASEGRARLARPRAGDSDSEPASGRALGDSNRSLAGQVRYCP